jgi:hypothetical protein
MTENIDPTVGQTPEDQTAATPVETPATPTWTPPSVPGAAPADTVTISKRTLTTVGLIALAAVMLAGTFATGFAVGTHASRFGGRDAFAPGGPQAMMGDFRSLDGGCAQGIPGQGQGRGPGGRGMMRDQDRQWPGGGQQQTPDAQGQLPAPTVPGR